MSQHAAVLFANDAFYLAFTNRDAAAMEAIWSDHPSVSCIHPGWQAVVGRRDVLDSWRAILGGSNPPQVRPLGARATLVGEVAVVVCYEELESAERLLVATNVFAREDGTWKLLHHQAGPSPLQPEQMREADPETPVQ